MGSLYQLIATAVATPLVLLWIVLVHVFGRKYEEIIDTIDPDEYQYPELYGLGFGLMELFHFDMTSDMAVKRIKQISEIKGKKYAAYYFYIMIGEMISLGLTIIPVVLLISALGDSPVFLLFGFVMIGLYIWYINETLNDKLEARRDELLMDFPKALSKLTLLVNSGMMLREAWRTVAESGDGVIYDEMRFTIDEIHQGVSELEAYQHFSDRCELKEIKRFTSSIVQNMVKGNAELAKFLREISDEMWNEKKAIAKRKGEAADSKLLIPTLLIFAGILALIMVPMLAGF